MSRLVDIVADSGDLQTPQGYQFLKQVGGPGATLAALSAPFLRSKHRQHYLELQMLEPTAADLRKLFDLSVDVLIIVDVQAERIVAYNPAYEMSLGYTAEWLETHNFLDIVHPDDRGRTVAEMAQAFGGVTTVLFEIRCVTMDGDTRWFQWSSRADPETGRAYAAGRDVTSTHVDTERLQRYADLLERTQQELKDAIEELTRVSNTDPLTGLLNRRAFEKRAMEELSRAERSGDSIAVAMLDIDHFKAVNDKYGHPMGDVVLREVARRLDAARRHSDIVGRWGGEEFVALFPETTLEESRAAAERLVLAVAARPITVGQQQIPIRLSGGVTAAAVTHGFGLLELVGAADRALLRAKKEGRDRIETEEMG